MPASKSFPTAKAIGPTLQDVAKLIRDEKVNNIIVLVGAGISTAAGIPDFRSPETGLYANLEQYNLPYPEAIFDLSYFYERPEAFFTLAKEIYPGNYFPTLTHYFFVLLHKKGLLKRVFSQNVDTLERIAGLPEDLLVEAHGSFATAHCMNCKQLFQAEELRPRVAKGEILRCDKSQCKDSSRNLIKSDIVFFGEALPAVFYKRLGDFTSCDLLITIGTSLKVHPFASLVDRVDDSCPRLLINLESVGEMDEYDPTEFGEGGAGMFGGYREEGFDFEGATRGGKQYARDVRWLGEADVGVRELAKALDWEQELDDLYDIGRAGLNVEDTRTNNVVLPDHTRTSHAKEEAQRVAKEIGKEVKDEPDQAHKGSKKDDDKEVDEIAQQIGKLDVKADATTQMPPPNGLELKAGSDDKKAAL